MVVFSNVFRKDRIILISFLAIGLLIYSPAMIGPLFFDDEHFIEKNRFVRDFKVKEIYTTGVTQGANLPGNFYRPNQQMVYALIYSISELEPVPFHLVSIILHILNAYLLFLFLLRLGFTRSGSFLGGLLFLVHPVQTEAVAYISGLADPLSFFFMLLGLLTWLRALNEDTSRRYIWGALSTALILMALLTKENMVIIFPLMVLVMVFLIIKKGNMRKPSAVVIPLLVLGLSLCYLILKFTVFNFSAGTFGLTEESNIYTESLSVRLATFLNVFREYVGLIVLPIDLFYEKPYECYISVLSGTAVVGWIFILLAIPAVVFVRRFPSFFLGYGWFALSLAPYFGIIPLNAMYLEHWLYVPMAGLSVLLAALTGHLHGNVLRFILTPLLAGIFLFLGYRTWSRCAEWGNIEKFYLNELKYSPDSIRIINNLGMYYSGQNQPAKAIHFYNRVIAIDDRYPQPHYNLALLYYKQGNLQEALNEFYFSLRINPDFVYTLEKLSVVYSVLNMPERAEAVRKLYINSMNGGHNTIGEIDLIMFGGN